MSPADARDHHDHPWVREHLQAAIRARDSRESLSWARIAGKIRGSLFAGAAA
jgi:hypothetical protein